MGTGAPRARPAAMLRSLLGSRGCPRRLRRSGERGVYCEIGGAIPCSSKVAALHSEVG